MVGGLAQDAEVAFPAGHFRGVVEGVGLAVGEVGHDERSPSGQLSSDSSVFNQRSK